MDDKLSTETIAIVASNLTAALLSTGTHRIDDSDPIGSVLHVYWEFCGELGEAGDRERGARR